MALEISSHISSTVKEQWKSFIETHPEGSVLQSEFFYDLFDATPHFEPVFLYCTENEKIVGLMLGVIIREADGIKGWFSSRHVVYGGPLVRVDHPLRGEIVELLLRELIKRTTKKAIFIQFRASYDLSEFDERFKKFNFRWHQRINLLIGTSDKDKVMAEMSASRMRQVKKSLKNGATIVEADSIAHIVDFYAILSALYSERVKKPLPGLDFFKAFFYTSKKNNYGRIFLVMFQDKVVGGILCPFWPEKAIFEWYVCGLDREFKGHGIYPSVLATWAAIDYAINNNFSKFDFMGLGKPGIDYGVRDFKMKFGGSVVNYGRYIRINRPLVYGIAELGYNVLAFLKKI